MTITPSLERIEINDSFNECYPIFGKLCHQRADDVAYRGTPNAERKRASTAFSSAYSRAAGNLYAQMRFNKLFAKHCPWVLNRGTFISSLRSNAGVRGLGWD